MKLRTRLIVALAATGVLATALTGCQQTPANCDPSSSSQQATVAPAGFSSPSRGGGFSGGSRSGGFGFRAPSFKAPSAPKPQRMNPAPKAPTKSTSPKVAPKVAPKPQPKPQQKPAPVPHTNPAPEVHNHYNTGGSGFNGFLGGMGLGWLIGQSGDNGQAVCN